MTTLHCKFPAGRSTRRSDNENAVDPQPERGLLYLQEEDGLLHFCWKDGSSGNVDDLILFPGDASFLPVANSPRSYVLKFASSDARHFYWCQDPDSSKDEERAGIINSLIQDSMNEDVAMEGPSEPAPVTASTSAAPPPAPVLSAPPTSPAPTPSNDFASILRQFAASNNAQEEYEPFSLPDVATPSAVLPLLSNSKVREALYPFLPAGLDHNEETLRRVVHSTELRRSLAGLDAALRSGLLGPFVQGLGLDSEAAMGLDNFLKAVQEKADREKASEGGMETD